MEKESLIRLTFTHLVDYHLDAQSSEVLVRLVHAADHYINRSRKSSFVQLGIVLQGGVIVVGSSVENLRHAVQGRYRYVCPVHE